MSDKDLCEYRAGPEPLRLAAVKPGQPTRLVRDVEHELRERAKLIDYDLAMIAQIRGEPNG